MIEIKYYLVQTEFGEIILTEKEIEELKTENEYDNKCNERKFKNE